MKGLINMKIMIACALLSVITATATAEISVIVHPSNDASISDADIKKNISR